jgi:thiamine biosynthesis lipoprotein
MHADILNWTGIYMKRKIIAAVIAGLLLFTGCSAEYSVNGTAGGNAGDSAKPADTTEKDADPLADRAFDRVIYDAMTVPYMSLRAYGQHAEDALIAGEVEIRRLDDLFSTGKADSDTARINANGRGTLSRDTAYLTEVSLDLHDSTGGAFDISVYPLMELWGFTSQFEDEKDNTGTSRREAPSDKEIADTLSLVDASKIEYDAETGGIILPDQMQIDFGGIAKGYTSQRIADIFRSNGVTSALIDLGGNIQTVGSKPDGSPWKVALNDRNRGTFLGVVQVKDMAVISSGGYERNFTASDGKVYHHIIDPATGYPADNGFSVDASVSIICSDGTMADGLSTSLYVMGPEKAIEYWRAHSDEFDFVLMTDDDKMYVSEGIEDSFSSDTYKYEIVRK